MWFVCVCVCVCVRVCARTPELTQRLLERAHARAVTEGLEHVELETRQIVRVRQVVVRDRLEDHLAAQSTAKKHASLHVSAAQFAPHPPEGP